ncbi:Uncharacterised protein [Salmonella enterica subsp. enterica]|uniref:Uncharacterized protein n=1 Tax=Salmonella enterica I TaxID=59201 RepID=A0A3S4LWY9_SALET|nr:Uncharacterised protein [Salmonella enterica subsp. enterica]
MEIDSRFDIKVGNAITISKQESLVIFYVFSNTFQTTHQSIEESPVSNQCDIPWFNTFMVNFPYGFQPYGMLHLTCGRK